MCLISLLIVSYLIQTDESLKKNENTNELKLDSATVDVSGAYEQYYNANLVPCKFSTLV